MDLRSTAIGKIVAGIATQELQHVDAGRSSPMLRILPFKKDEIRAAAEILSELEIVEGHRITLKIAATETWDGCRPEWFLAEGKTRSWYRSHEKHGLVLFDYEEQPDEQSLKNMHAISDGTILLPGAVADDGGRRRWILETVMSEVGERREVPERLQADAESVFGSVDKARGEVSLRQWVAFLIGAVERLGPGKKAVDRETVDEAVEASLPLLGLFPDPGLFGLSDAQKRRRLVMNARLAAMCNPKGKELEEEEIEKRIEECLFQTEDGEPYDDDGQKDWRSRCLGILFHRGDSKPYSDVPLRIWEQLFSRDNQKKGLGTRIDDYLEAQHQGRRQEYLDLEVMEGLDDNDTEAAKTFLDAEPPLDGDGEPLPLLVDVLTKPLRKAVEKLANRQARSVDDPLAEILRYLADPSTREELGEDQRIELHLEPPSEDTAGLSLPLFRFLYAATLREIGESSELGDGLSFGVDPAILEGPRDFVAEYNRLFPPSDNGDEGEERDLDKLWAKLGFVLATPGGEKQIARFAWKPVDNPGHIAFARIIASDPGKAVFVADSDDFDSWCGHAWDPEIPLAGEIPRSESAAVLEWLDGRERVFHDWRTNGICADGLQEYVDCWSRWLERVRNDHVPQGAADKGLDDFISMETVSLGNRRTLLLATHPLRLRWVYRYFGYMKELIGKALDGSLHLNPEVEELFFSRLGEMTPHKQPPVICTGHGQVMMATRELGWSEEYSAIERDSSPSADWVSSVDDQSIVAMAGIVQRYVQAFPHKRDELSILFISRDGDPSHVERLVKTVLKGEFSDVILSVHIIAPVLAHDEIARRLESLDDRERTYRDLLPAVRTILHEDGCLRDDGELDVLELDDRIDLALVPNLFGTRAQVNERTTSIDLRSGSFNPLFDTTSHELENPDRSKSQNVSRALLSERGDQLLEGWSSIQVWRKNETPVGSGAIDEVDFFSLQVRFTESHRLFMKLHEWAHWVATLDPFVGREQIEALSSRPDIVTVKPNVGKSGNYTLVVSSQAGKDFVVTRLRNKLERDLHVAKGQEATDLAVKIYESGREFTPGILLRALGLGRTTHEVLGQIVARWAVEERFGRPQDCEFETWLNLDDQLTWFGGPNRPRADLLRIIGRHIDGRLHLAFHVLEAKFRENEDVGPADRQITSTIDVLEPAFRPTKDGTDESEFTDSPFWRRLLVEAIQQSASRSTIDTPFNGLWVRGGEAGAPGGLPLDIREMVEDGDYVVDEFIGILCSVAANDDKVAEEFGMRDSGHHWIRLGRSGFRRILGEFRNDARPQPHEAPKAEPAAEPEVVDTETGPVPSDEGPEKVESKPKGLGVDILEERYQIVLNALEEFNIPVSIPEGERFDEGPAFYEIRVIPGAGIKTDKVLAQTQELKLRLKLPHELEIRGIVDRGAVVFQIPKEDNERYFVDAKELWDSCERKEGALAVPFARDAKGEPVWMEFSSSDSPHLLIGGTTGSGKSVALESIIGGLCHYYGPDELRLFLIDPKGVELERFAASPHVEGEIGTWADDAIQLLGDSVSDMQSRYSRFKAAKVKDIVSYNSAVAPEERIPWHVVVLDEYADLTSSPEDRKEIEGLLKRLAQKARAAGIHVIVATQKPSAEIISTSIRSNLPAQLALRVKTSQDSRIIMDETGAETLAGKGDAFFRDGKTTRRVQAAKS